MARQKLEGLAEAESAVVQALDKNLKRTDGAPSTVDLAQCAIRALSTDDRQVVPRTIGRWPWWGRPDALARRLCQTLIVSVRPVSRGDFVRLYGLSPEDLAEASKRGECIIDLYEWESDKANNFPRHEQHFAYTLAPLFADRVLLRVGSIRRNWLFTALAPDQPRIAESARDIASSFEKLLSAYSASELERMTRGSSPQQSARQLAWRFEYVNRLLEPDHDDRERLADFKRKLTPARIRLLDAMKYYHTQRLTGAFGGASNFTGAEVEVCVRAGLFRLMQPSERRAASDKLREMPRLPPQLGDRLKGDGLDELAAAKSLADATTALAWVRNAAYGQDAGRLVQLRAEVEEGVGTMALGRRRALAMRSMTPPARGLTIDLVHPLSRFAGNDNMFIEIHDLDSSPKEP